MSCPYLVQFSPLTLEKTGRQIPLPENGPETFSESSVTQPRIARIGNEDVLAFSWALLLQDFRFSSQPAAASNVADWRVNSHVTAVHMLTTV